MPDGLRNDGRSGAGGRRAWDPSDGLRCAGPSVGGVGDGGGAGRLGAVPAGWLGAEVRAAGAAPVGPAAGAGVRARAAASTGPDSPPAAVRGAGFGPSPGCAAGPVTAGPVTAAPERAVPVGLRLTTTVRRCFLTTTMRRRSSPPPVAGRPVAAPAVPAAAGLSSDGAAIFCSGLRLIRVARGRGFSSVSGRSDAGLGDAGVCSSLILNNYNADPEVS